MTATNTPISSTTIPQRWLLPARTAWILLAASCIALFLLGSVESIRTAPPNCAAPAACPSSVVLSQEDAQIAAEMGLPVPFLPLALAVSIAARLSLAVVGLLIFWRKSDDWMALLFSGALMSILLEGIQGTSSGFNALLNLFFAIGGTLFIPIPFVFPSGRVEPTWMRWPLVVLTVLFAVLLPFLSNTDLYATFSVLLTLPWVILAVYAMAYRYYRVSNAVERQQIKWVLVGLSASFIVGIYYTSIIVIFPVSQPSQARVTALLLNLPLYVGFYSFFAFSMLVAMLRHRLWDIDILIRRTLQYTLLTVLLALVYFGTIVLLQTLFGSFSGEQSPVVIVLSTLLIAALFTPLRRRVQEVIDRRFFRKKYDAQQVLAAFAITARDETDLAALTGELQRVVQETLQPEGVGVWLVNTPPIQGRR